VTLNSIKQPAAMTHAAIPREERLEAELIDGLIRVSVGIEHATDQRKNLQQTIDAALD
jgi:cystathionine gamma-lyase